MPITGEVLFNDYKNLLNTDSTGTYYDVVNGGASHGKTVTLLNIINQDTVAHNVTLSFNRYSGGSYSLIYEKLYVIAAGRNEISVDFMTPLLPGANPDKIQVKFAESISSGKKVTISASGIDFS